MVPKQRLPPSVRLAEEFEGNTRVWVLVFWFETTPDSRESASSRLTMAGPVMSSEQP